MARLFACIAALGGFAAIAAGTIGAHVLRDSGDYPADQVSAYFTGVQYQFYHVLALLAIALLCARKPTGMKEAAGWAMIVGTILFSGSMYVFGFTGGHVFGYIAASGGVIMMISWLLLAVGVLEIKLKPDGGDGAG